MFRHHDKFVTQISNSKAMKYLLLAAVGLIIALITTMAIQPNNAQACQSPPDWAYQTWINIDPNTRSITKIDIYRPCQNPYGGIGGEPQPPQPVGSINVYGSCHPTDCDWRLADLYKDGANNFYAYYDQGFAQRDLRVTYQSEESLIIESNTHFTDGSGRADYTSTDYFFRARNLNLIAFHSQKCLDVDISNDPILNGALVQQWDCLGPQQANQVWTFRPVGEGYYQIVAGHSNKCLDVDASGAADADGTLVQQWDCLGPQQTNQLWTLRRMGGGYFQIVAKHSDKCLDVSGVSPDTGAWVHQWQCLGPQQTNQLWKLSSFHL